MKIPDIVGPIEPSGDDLKGIIYEIKNKYHVVNPIKSKVIVAKTNGNNENTVDATVLWNKNSWQSSNLDFPWLQISFPKSLIVPTAYSIRGVNATSGGRCFAAKWDVYGIYSDKENDNSTWIKLATNSYSETLFCRDLIGGACKDFHVGTYNLGTIKSSKGFRHIRFVLNESCAHSACKEKHYFATSGVDLYGTLYSFNSHCSYSIKQTNNIMFILLYMMICPK